MGYKVSFRVEPAQAPVVLEAGANLSEHLTTENSPILFGCRTGICGTCLIEVCAEEGEHLHARTSEEEDLLSIIAPENPNARLACQIRLNTHLTIRPLEETP